MAHCSRCKDGGPCPGRSDWARRNRDRINRKRRERRARLRAARLEAAKQKCLLCEILMCRHSKKKTHSKYCDDCIERRPQEVSRDKCRRYYWRTWRPRQIKQRKHAAQSTQ